MHSCKACEALDWIVSEGFQCISCMEQDRYDFVGGKKPMKISWIRALIDTLDAIGFDIDSWLEAQNA